MRTWLSRQTILCGTSKESRFFGDSEGANETGCNPRNSPPASRWIRKGKESTYSAPVRGQNGFKRYNRFWEGPTFHEWRRIRPRKRWFKRKTTLEAGAAAIHCRRYTRKRTRKRERSSLIPVAESPRKPCRKERA